MADDSGAPAPDSEIGVAFALWRTLRPTYRATLTGVDEELKLFLLCRAAAVGGKLRVD